MAEEYAVNIEPYQFELMSSESDGETILMMRTEGELVKLIEEYGLCIFRDFEQPSYRLANRLVKVTDTDNFCVVCVVVINSTGYFLQDVLFPYAKDNVQGFLEKTWETVLCKEDVMALKRQANEDKHMEGAVLIPDEKEDVTKDDGGPRNIVIDAVVKNVIWQMSSDRKTTALKQLQGHIWKEAFESGKIKGEVFDDVVPAFKQWTSNQIKIYIYSSGSIDAQKLLFGNSKFGDLLQYVSGHFDTTAGVKSESRSYKKIAEDIDMKPSRILFVTDLIKEARAAFEAGYTTVVSVRPGNAALSNEDKKDFITISSFNELFIEEQSHRTKKSKEDD